MSTQPNLSIPIEVTVEPQAIDINLTLGTGLMGPKGDTGAQGPQGQQGPQGAKGDKGDQGNAATVSAGTTTTGAPGTNAAVSNSGSTSAAVFDFTIPRGDVGPQGPTGSTGAAATIDVGTTQTVSAGTPALVVNSGTTSEAVLDFQIPEGPQGIQGIQGIQGVQGPQGQAATIATGTTSTGAPGTSASVVNSGTNSAAVFDFTIPEGQKGDTGDKGDKGDTGDAATIAVGTVTTGAPGSPVTVTNSGTSGAAVFDFSIPQGYTGATGPAGTSFTWEGNWSDATAYQIQDVVFYNGSSYVATTAIPAGPGNPAPNTTSDWNLVAQKGDTGATGAAGDRYTTTSATSLLNSNGTKVLVVEAGLAYIPEQAIIIAASTIADTHMHGTVVSYNASTGDLVADVTNHTGSAGPYSAWDVSLEGAAGIQGPAGTAATIAVGTVATGAPGSSVVVTNSGTSSAAVFDFTIPRGDTGATGSFVGDAATITTGTLADARLTSNVTLLSNETTGTGSIVRATSPTLTTPNIGAATGTSVAFSGGASSPTVPLFSFAYTFGGSGTVFRIVQHSGPFEPLNVRTNGGVNGVPSSRIDYLRTIGIGFGGDLNSTTTPVFQILDSRLRYASHSGDNLYRTFRGVDLSDVRFFNTYTDSANYERGNLYWASNVFTLATEAAGTGTVRGFAIAIGGTERFAISAAGAITTGDWQASTIGVAKGGTGATDAPTARTNLGLGNVENTALSTWAGSTSLTTLGTVTTGTWQGSAVAIEHGGTGAVTAPLARAALGLGNVENVALSTWAGSTNLTTLGTITTGTWNGSAIPVANGGTGGTSASDARTNLGLAIGSDVQAFVSATSTGTDGIVRAGSPTIATPTLNGYRLAARSVTASGNILDSDSIILASAAGGGVALTLPPAASVAGQVFEIKRTDGSVSTVVVSDPTSSIDGEAAVYLKIQYTSLTIASNGSAYFIL